MEENNVKDHLLIFSNLTEMNTTNGRKKKWKPQVYFTYVYNCKRTNEIWSNINPKAE